jgi:flavin-binding protein dodecin
MAVVKNIEIIAESKKSWEDAAAEGVKTAAKSVKNIRSVWVKDQKATVKGDKITAYRVTMAISFELK